MNSDLLRDSFEGLIVLAIGGMTWSSFGKLRRREIAVVRCTNCSRPISRAYPNCPKCGS